MHHEIQNTDGEYCTRDSKQAVSAFGVSSKGTEADQLASSQAPAKPFKKPVLVPPLPLAELKLSQEAPEQAKAGPEPTLFAVAAAAASGSRPIPATAPQRQESSQKTLKSIRPSSYDYDLVTIKNTEDYNNFMKNASENKRTDMESLKKFEQKLQSYLLRDSSVDESNKEARTFRDINLMQAGEYSDLIMISIEDTQKFKRLEDQMGEIKGQLSKTQKEAARTGIGRGSKAELAP